MIDTSLEDAVSLGLSAEEFLASDIGAYVSERAEQQRASALEDLANVSPSDSQAIAALQFKVKVADAAAQWLADAVILGRQAIARIQQMEFPD